MILVSALFALLCLSHVDAFFGIIEIMHPKPPADDAKMLGCYVDKGHDRAIAGEAIKWPKDEVVQKCYERAKEMRASIFGIQGQEWCYTNPDAHLTYAKWGKHGGFMACTNGRGGEWANDIYEISYPPLKPEVPDIDLIAGGGWKLVRHVPKGNKWFNATDNLNGTEEYGTPCGPLCDDEWSKKFDDAKYNQFLFISGDQKKWLIADKSDVLGWYHNAYKPIFKSSNNPDGEYLTKAKWYRRDTNPEDPWISLTDHHIAKNGEDVLYGEAGTEDRAAEDLCGKHWGANVYIRQFKMDCRVEFFKDWKYKGDRDVYIRDTKQVQNDDSMSSFHISPGCCVTFFAQPNMEGKSQKYCEDVELLGDDWNDKVSSIKLTRKPIVVKDCPDNGFMYPGTDIGQDHSTDTWEGCGRKCRDEPKCKFFTYTISSKRCSLKSAILDRKENPDKISGAKNCAPEPPSDETGSALWKAWWEHLVRVDWNWEVKWENSNPNFNFKILKTGQVQVGGNKTWIQSSHKTQFPGPIGWWRFKIGNFWYYLKLTHDGMDIHKFSYDAECKQTFNGMTNYCGKGGLVKIPTGSLAFRWQMWFKRMPGSWKLWGNTNIKFLTGGKCEIEGKTFDVLFSDKPQLPQWYGWWRVEYKKYMYYFRVGMKGLEVNRFGAGADDEDCKKTFNGLPNYCGTAIGAGAGSSKWYDYYKRMLGTWNLNIIKWQVRFESSGFMVILTSNNAKVKVLLSDMPRFPSLFGWFKFEYQNNWYYIRLVGRSLKLEWFRFSLTCDQMLENIPLLSNYCNRGTGSKVHPCDTQDNGGCSQLCIKEGRDKDETFHCECDVGFTLEDDGKTCAEATSCQFRMGDGVGGKEIKIGTQTGEECVQACIAYKRTNDPAVNGVTIKANEEGGCYCEIDMTSWGPETEWKSCLLDGNPSTPQPPPEVQTTEGLKDLTYVNYKDKECRTNKWEMKGCYDTKIPFKRGKLLIYWRHDIEWSKERHPKFALSLACACGEAARRHGVKWFGLHYWGECWELDPDEIKPAPGGDCTLADGNYQTKCSKMGERYGNYECLGIKSYYVYKLL